MTDQPERKLSRHERLDVTFRVMTELNLIVAMGAGAGPLDSAVIHGPGAAPDPHWRVNASLKGAKHEQETLVRQVARDGSSHCPRHTWGNADLVGRCGWCGKPLPT